MNDVCRLSALPTLPLVSSNISHSYWKRCVTRVRYSRCNIDRRAKRVNCMMQSMTGRQSIAKTFHDSSFVKELREAVVPTEKLKILLEYGKKLDAFPKSEQKIENRVMGCTTKTYLLVELKNGNVYFNGTSDSELTKGLIWILKQTLSSLPANEVIQFDIESFAEVLKSPGIMTPSRTNGFLNLMETLKRKTRMLQKEFPKFPSLIIRSHSLHPMGSFAEAQAKFLNPKTESVKGLANQLQEKNVGVVAHFYMDPEVQGLLTAASEIWPHIHISDSILMSESAVQMAEKGCQHIAVLGVDFMSENVRAVLDRAGYAHVPVYRMSTAPIGCSLAEAASSLAYEEYLKCSVGKGPALHIIYINTSLQTKAISQNIVPTITCTSGNVLQTILQSFAQIPNLNILYGPDTYMGHNIYEMFKHLTELSDEEISDLHPAHNRQTIQSLLNRFQYFKEGTCIVHHLFGGEVCSIVKEAYGDAYITAHFEVPGEMFSLAMEARKRGMGVIGSTSNILSFIQNTVANQAIKRTTDRLEFVLGTESGMITSIVRSVQSILSKHDKLHDLEVEIVFPVASSAITTESQNHTKSVNIPDDLIVVPGVASSEGCSTEGGCANCPYMKMNTLHALQSIIAKIDTIDDHLSSFYPRIYNTKMEIEGEIKFMQDVGTEPILEMRQFQKTGYLSESLVKSIYTKNKLI